MNNTNTQIVAGPKKPKWMKALFGFAVALVVGVVGYFGSQSMDLFRAAITEIPDINRTANLYIPGYQAGPSDTGTIGVFATNNTAANQSLMSVSFRLRYTPTDGLVFNENSIVFNTNTVFQSADLQGVNTDVPGEITVSLFSNNAPLLLPGTQPLFELAVQTNASVGSTINLTADNVEVVEQNASGSPVISTNYTAIETSPFQIVGQNDLRLLSVETLDATHLRLNFNDFIQNPGLITDYAIVDPLNNPLIQVLQVDSGTTRGFGQDTVVLTTQIQAPGAAYELAIGTPTGAPSQSNLAGNTVGTMNFNYARAPFVGFGQTANTISTFGVVSAVATGYRTIDVTLTDAPEPSSVSAAAFRITTNAINNSANPVATATLNGNVVTLQTQQPLVLPNTYVVNVNNDPLGNTNVRRASDNALLGLNIATLAGYKYGPQITSASVTSATSVAIVFDEPIQLANPNAQVGNIYVTGQSANPVAVNPANVSITGTTLTIQNVPTTAETNYTFVSNNNLSNGNQPLDTRYDRISFWGFGSSQGPASTGTATLTRATTVEVTPANGINYANVTTNNVAIVYYDVNQVPQVLNPSTVAVAANGNLSVVVPNSDDILWNQHYHVIISNNAGSTLAVADFAMATDFEMTSAQAVLSNEVVVTFSENVDQSFIDPNYFLITDVSQGTVIPVSTATVEPGFRAVRMRVNTNLNPGAIYYVASNAGLTGAPRSFVGGKVIYKTITPFVGFQTQSAPSPVRLQTVTPISRTEVELAFSGDVDPATLTPVNIRVAPMTRTGLTISQINPVDARTVRLTTNQQVADRQYFVTLSNVLDANGLLIQNNPIPSFFTYVAPQVNILSVTPNVVTNEVEQVVVVAGQNLDVIQSARLGTTAVTINQQTAAALNVLVPAGFAEGGYDLVFTDNTGQTTTVANAVTVTLPNQPMRIVSTESRSLPNRVAPNGTTQVTFWVLVEDPVDISSVESVTIDLEQIGGNRAQQMQPDPGLQPRNRQFYTFTTTVSPNTPTQETPYTLAVQARRGAEVANGTVEITVTRNILSSQAPAFEQAYSNPATVAPDGATQVTLSARVSDPDGANTITSVVADLGQLGLGFVPMNPLQIAGSANELVTGFYATNPFTVPATTREGDYVITLTATDETGESAETELTLTVSSALTAPTIDETRTHVTPRTSLPKDGKTPFRISASVTDPDGIEDVDTVVAYFGSLGISPVSLTMDPASSTTGRTGLFSSGDIVVPTTALLGVHDIEIIATDESGGTGRLIVRVDVNDKDILGDAPIVLDSRGYSNPAVAVNDGATRISLYAFVRDDDGDLDSVIINLSGIGQVGAEAPSSFTQTENTESQSAQVSNGNCPSNSNVIACMQPSFQEGNDGRWFVLPDVTISKSTQAGLKEVPVIATDATGKTGRGVIEITIRDQFGAVNESQPPRMVAAVPVSSGSIEVAFSKEILATSVSPAGRNFTISAKNNVSDTLSIIAASINATGDVITLNTDSQVEGKEYVVTVNDSLTDLGGVSPLSNNRVFFSGYSATNQKAPVVHYIGSTAPNSIQVEFQSDVRPSSVSRDAVKVYEVDSNKELAVRNVSFDQSGKSLVITTDTQRSNARYRVEVGGVSSSSGLASREPIVKFFTAETFRAAAGSSGGTTGGSVGGTAIERADFNGDGTVDFADFTIFSSVYGQSIFGNGTNNQGLSPITSTPDSTVPHTSPVQ